MNQYQSLLTPAQEAALHDDIRTRITLQARMSEHSYPVLAYEFGLSESSIFEIVRGRELTESFKRANANKIWEIRERRKIWQISRDEMRNYTLAALAKRHGVCANTIVRHNRLVKWGPRDVDEPTFPRDISRAVHWLTRPWRIAA